MEKMYEVRVDITVSKTLYTSAASQEEAERIIKEKLDKDPYYDAKTMDSVLNYEIVEVSESEDEEPEDDDFGSDLKEAMAYVREQLGEDRLSVVRAQTTVCMDQRRPVDTDYNDEVHDLLEEWGEEHDLSEEWWSESIELEDIIVRL